MSTENAVTVFEQHLLGGRPQLYQTRSSALQAFQTGNLLSREMRLYTAASGAYGGTDDGGAFDRLTQCVEEIRAAAEDAFLDIWQRGPASGKKTDEKV